MHRYKLFVRLSILVFAIVTITAFLVFVFAERPNFVTINAITHVATVTADTRPDEDANVWPIDGAWLCIPLDQNVVISAVSDFAEAGAISDSDVPCNMEFYAALRVPPSLSALSSLTIADGTELTFRVIGQNQVGITLQKQGRGSDQVAYLDYLGHPRTALVNHVFLVLANQSPPGNSEKESLLAFRGRDLVIGDELGYDIHDILISASVVIHERAGLQIGSESRHISREANLNPGDVIFLQTKSQFPEDVTLGFVRIGSSSDRREFQIIAYQDYPLIKIGRFGTNYYVIEPSWFTRVTNEPIILIVPTFFVFLASIATLYLAISEIWAKRFAP